MSAIEMEITAKAYSAHQSNPTTPPVPIVRRTRASSVDGDGRKRISSANAALERMFLED
jgi:hypothetical protein